MTISEGLTLLKTVSIRKNELLRLRSEVSTKDTYLRDAQKVVEPQYDVKKVDEQVSKLSKLHFDIETAIKKVNATTNLPIDEVDMSVVFNPLT